LEGVKFRRQEPFGKYVVDFVSYEKSVVIEVDGGQHNDDEALRKDRERTEYLRQQGFRVIRFWNNDVTSNMDGVLRRIKDALKE
jgi:very-short-patch-repair endonuclease